MTPDQILSILREHPDATLEALGRFKVAHPWVDGEHVPQSYRRLATWAGTYERALVYYLPPEEAGLYGAPVGSGWYTPDEQRFDSREEAKASVDETLRGEGFWLL